MASLNALLYDLYRAARELPIATFQEDALLLLKPALNFESAIWGAGQLTPLGLSPHRAHLHDVGPEEVLRWREITHLDKVIPTVVANLGSTVQIHAPTLFADANDGVMREYTLRFRRQTCLVTALPRESSGQLEWISLYRPDPDAQFTDAERSFCDLLMPHLVQAFEINQLCQQAAVLADFRHSNQFMALFDHRGIVRFAQKGFIDLLKSEWTQLDEFIMPAALIKGIWQSEEGVFIGRHVRCQGRTTGDLIFVTARPLNRIDLLPPRRAEIAMLIASGLSNKEVAAKLRISPNTVRNQLAAAYQTLSVSTKSDLRKLANP